MAPTSRADNAAVAHAKPDKVDNTHARAKTAENRTLNTRTRAGTWEG